MKEKKDIIDETLGSINNRINHLYNQAYEKARLEFQGACDQARQEGFEAGVKSVKKEEQSTSGLLLHTNDGIYFVGNKRPEYDVIMAMIKRIDFITGAGKLSVDTSIITGDQDGVEIS